MHSAARASFICILSGLISLGAVGGDAQGQGRLEVSQSRPDVIVSGYNVYSPAILAKEADRSATLFFGGWLTAIQKPHDALYKCQLDWTGTSWENCYRVQKIANVEDLGTAAKHLNDPTIYCEQNTDSCDYAATVCVDGCDAQSRNQVWIGRSRRGQEFSRLGPLLTEGAAEPSLGISRDADPAPVIYFVRRGNPSTIFMQRVDWTTLSPIGSPSPEIVDQGDFAISNATYLHIGRYHILAWNRLRALDPKSLPPLLRDITIAYSTALDGNQWSSPQALLFPNGGQCALITPELAEDPQGRIELFLGEIARAIDGSCRLTNWSRRIMRYLLVLTP
jgi:hypothetical protein